MFIRGRFVAKIKFILLTYVIEIFLYFISITLAYFLLKYVARLGDFVQYIRNIYTVESRFKKARFTMWDLCTID